MMVLLAASACVSTRTIPQAAYSETRAYEWVVVETVTGDEFELLDARFRDDSIVGALLRDARGGPRTAIAVGDLERVLTKEIDRDRSTFLVAGVAISIFLLGQFLYHAGP